MGCRKELSIIIPVYKTEKYLPKCLNSVLKAVDSRMEVLIINDGSPDCSEEIILRYIQKKPDIFYYYKKENGGLSDVKNYGLSKAAGDFVVFLDSDDYIEPEMYQDMLRIAYEEKADVVICDIFMDYEDETPQKRVSCTSDAPGSLYYQIFDTWLMPASWNKLVRKDLYEGLEFPKGMNNEDVCVTPISLARADKISVVHKPYYHYLQRAGSIQNSGFSENRFVILDTSKLALERIRECPVEKQLILKDSLYLHQILNMAMYPIREQKNRKRREQLLTIFMERTFLLFPDFMGVRAFRTLIKSGKPVIRLYRRISLWLLEQRKYHLICNFWEVCNRGFSLKDRICRR